MTKKEMISKQIEMVQTQLDAANKYLLSINQNQDKEMTNETISKISEAGKNVENIINKLNSLMEQLDSAE